MSKFIDLTGQKFGRLTVIRRSYPNGTKNTYWLCRCECGIEKAIQGGSLRNGATKSCGCLNKESPNNRRRLDPGLANMRAAIRNYENNAKHRGLEYNLTEKQFYKLTQQNCYYCGVKPNNIANGSSFGKYIYNGIDRVDNTKGYTIDNVVTCCHQCNSAKRKLTQQEFKDWIGRVHNKMNLSPAL